MAVEVAVMPTPHDAVSPVMYGQNTWPQPLSPNMESPIHAHSPVGSVSSPVSVNSPFSHTNSPIGVCSPTAVQSPHMQAHSPGMQAASPMHCPPLNVNINVKQELSGADYGHCSNLTHLLRSSAPEFSGAFSSTLGHMGPPAQREILDGKYWLCAVQTLVLLLEGRSMLLCNDQRLLFLFARDVVCTRAL